MKKTQPSRSSTSIQNCHKVLKFWHQVEFFIPFNLDKQLEQFEDEEQNLRYLTEFQLRDANAELLWQVEVPQEKELRGFDLYLGLFDIAQITEVTQSVLRDSLSENEGYEETERSDFEGTTCFARIQLNHQGVPRFNEISVSTVPWALGVLKNEGPEGLSFEAFQHGQRELKNLLRKYKVDRNNPRLSKSVEKNDSYQTGSISGNVILSLLEILCDWASYKPGRDSPARPVALIRAKFDPLSEKNQPKDNSENQDNHKLGDAEKDKKPNPEIEIDILNSFYCRDIERSIESFQKGTTLARYLTAAKINQRLDLYSTEGRKYIVKSLSPNRLNNGRWLEDPERGMSLMQQFAIGKILALSEGEIFSVNGPPGTGKTTMLREIFAENVTRRARVLAGYDNADATFQTNKATINFPDENQDYEVRLLKSDLTGFEMVVVSTNNAAVENISRDLPKIDSIGRKSWLTAEGKSKFCYLQGIAHKVAAQNDKGKYKDLISREVPWGLISCALGKKKNRERFANSIRFPGKDENKLYPYGLKKPYAKGFDPNKHQSIWTWSKCYQGPKFAEAKILFQNADMAVQQRINDLQELATITLKTQGETQDSFIRAAKKRFLDAQKSQKAAQTQVNQLEAESLENQRQLEIFRELERTHTQQAPNKFVQLIGLPKAKKYKLERERIRKNLREQLLIQVDLPPKLNTARDALKRANNEIKSAENKYNSSEKQWGEMIRRLDLLSAKFPNAQAPADPKAIEEDDWQIESIWRDETLNQLRSELFAAALQLHEAWLAEALKNGFSKNILAMCDILSGKRLANSQHAVSMWQSLFLVVPVISSTFAAYATQFRDVEAGAFGWLFIDEAGQAVPQAAVGALWRSKRAVVVGDPLQIEPVFTAPIKLIETLFHLTGLPNEIKVMPHKDSCQSLADTTNIFGTEVAIKDESKEWIGSPLRVHRRCSDPMFSVANVIAYNNKMIHGSSDRRPSPDSLDIGKSAWVNISGATSYKQIVPEQIDIVFRALVALYQTKNALPPLYIISPFRQVKAELMRKLSDLKRWQEVALCPPTKNALSKWCESNIGTVHTFQGKENSIVWMVLGCDSNTPGPISWVTSKPNILNVALTRAKHRFFLIGDKQAWGGKKYFEKLDGELLVISGDDFIARMNHLQ